jgi:hypothetical protein
MSERLHLAISVSRPWNLSRMLWFYLSEVEPHPFELRIHLNIQGPEPDFKGQNKTNECLKMIQDGWVYFWCDDTIQYPSCFRRLSEVISGHPDAGAIVFSEQRPGHILHASKDHVKPCEICGSMICYKRDFIGDAFYDTAQHGDAADGWLAQHLFIKDPSRWVFIDEVLLKFNSLMAP